MIEKGLKAVESFAVKTRELIISRHFSCGRLCYAHKKDSSTRWMQRHVSDPYVKQAVHDGYRCRSAYKLLELDNKFHFFKPGKVVIDCGASPGSWTQVAVQRVLHPTRKGFTDSRNKGMVIAVDLLDIKHVLGAIMLGRSDFTSRATQEKISSFLPSSGVDVIISDMAPNSTGHRSLDHEAILELAETVLHYGIKTLTSGGIFLCKLWDGSGSQDFVKLVEKSFKTVRKHKPRASRNESAELYEYAQGFT